MLVPVATAKRALVARQLVSAECVRRSSIGSKIASLSLYRCVVVTGSRYITS